MEALTIVNSCVEALIKIGFDKASVHLIYNDKSELNVEYNEIKLLRNVQEATLYLTGIVDQKRGTMALNKLDSDSIDQAIQEVYGIAKSSMPDPAYDISTDQGHKTYEFGPQAPDLDLIYNRNEEFLDYTRTHFPNAILEANLDHNLKRHYYSNSNGVQLQSHIGTYNGNVFVVTKEGQNTSSFNGTGFQSSELEQSIHTMGSIQSLLEQSTEQTETRMLPSHFVGDVIITPDCQDFLQFLLGELTDYPLIAGTSIYKDKLNEQITDTQLTIHSNPMSPELAGGYFITGDGFEAKNATILDRGTLKHFFLTNYGSKKTNQPIGPNRGESLVIEPGDQRYAGMIQSIEKGILLCRFSGGNPAPNGDFSGVAKNSYYIENGAIQYPLSETMIAGNIAEIFRNLKGISQEQVDFGSEKIPWFHATGVSISGQ